MNAKYILKDRQPIEVDLMTWASWFEKGDNRRVGFETIGDFDVSTVFLGLDHQFGSGPPLLFETMVFRSGSGSDLWSSRCSTWEQAEAMHREGCEYVRNNLMN